MPKIIEKIIVKEGCDERNCGFYDSCPYDTYESKDIVETIFQGSFIQCQKKAKEIGDTVGKERRMGHCRYSSKSGYDYLSSDGYIIVSDAGNYSFIAKDNTEAFMSYEDVSPKTTEDLIKEDKKAFRSSMLSKIIKKSPCKTG